MTIIAAKQVATKSSLAAKRVTKCGQPLIKTRVWGHAYTKFVLLHGQLGHSNKTAFAVETVTLL